MFDAAGFITPEGVFVMAGLRMVAWIVILWVPLLVLGKNPRKALDEITTPEAIFFGLFSIGASFVVSGQFPG